MPLIPALGKKGRRISVSLDQPSLSNKFQDSQDCTEKPYLRKKMKADYVLMGESII